MESSPTRENAFVFPLLGRVSGADPPAPAEEIDRRVKNLANGLRKMGQDGLPVGAAPGA